MPDTPAAGSEWPSMLFAASSCSALVGRPVPAAPTAAGERPGVNIALAARMSSAAPTSMGSPSGVPVPCICNAVTAVGATSAAWSTVRMRLCCAGPLGAVRLLLRPSWLTAAPSRTARG
ncbi:hypothetical protein Vretifemale_7519 [Volvox reticuliferus]|nr:hypothetical protein Vretifemale_7519 [Volvox reticuliferus]